MNGLRFTHYTAAAAREGHDVVEDVFRRSYRDAIESGHAFDSPEAFMQRFDAYTDPARGSGFELVVAYLDDVAVGQSWGWPLTPKTAWWVGLRLNDSASDMAEFIEESGARTFALSEIMVDQAYAGRGIARELHDELLKGRSEVRATLLVEPDNDRAYSAYRRWGWARVGNLTPSWPDAPTFDVLMKHLEEASS
ncbi:GNAT family N-acetyltransferase [Nocardia salmonicida]|uniref:GNAT family N-acetyltransferase n=1 Tax=Nocardia salmonicida TaxID=53431 RepID=UPI000B0C06A9|nr:GNAT family N-acetyltransferase [Nocardia salmonicida]